MAIHPIFTDPDVKQVSISIHDLLRFPEWIVHSRCVEDGVCGRDDLVFWCLSGVDGWNVIFEIIVVPDEVEFLYDWEWLQHWELGARNTAPRLTAGGKHG